jgi:hypothetical protein
MGKGQKRTLCKDPLVEVRFTMTTEAHQIDDDEPIPVMPVHTVITKGKKTWSMKYDGDMLLIPNDMPNEAKVPLMKMVQEVFDLNSSEEMDDWWYDHLKASWPPPKSEWINKREEA